MYKKLNYSYMKNAMAGGKRANVGVVNGSMGNI